MKGHGGKSILHESWIKPLAEGWCESILGPDRCAARATLAVLTTFVISFGLSLAAYVHVGLPRPIVHDEFANLLQADTFVHGRLTNPPHPLAKFFVTFHELQHPTYASKFPPGSGALLALGEIIWQPILGAWLSVALGCAAVCWALQSWFKPGWSALGGVLAAVSPIVHLWSVSYRDGGGAMLGGALATAAAVRAVRSPCPAHGVIGGVGAFVLFNCRPFEGALLCAVLGSLVIVHACRTPSSRRMILARVLPAGMATTALLGIFNLYYNWRVTGSAWQLPYALDARQTMYAPLMFWQKPTQPSEPTIPWITRFHSQMEWDEYVKQLTWPGYFGQLIEKYKELFFGYVRPFWLEVVFLVGILCIRRSRPVRWAVATCIAVPTLHFLCTPWFRLNYFAPLMTVLLVPVIVGLVWLSRLRIRSWPVGSVAASLIIAGIAWSDFRWSRDFDSWRIPLPMEMRSLLLQTLKNRGGQHLIFVQHDINGGLENEVCFNAADIDASPIVFARDLGLTENKQLEAYYPLRRAWSYNCEKFTLTELER